MNTRILGPNDIDLVPQVVSLFSEEVMKLAPLYGQSTVERMRGAYTEKKAAASLDPDSPQRLVVRKINGSLDGFLLETHIDPQEPSTMINWVLAKNKGRGVGTALIVNSLARAQNENKEYVAIGVDSANHDAKRLYERLGFRENIFYSALSLQMMAYVFDKK